MEVAVLDTPVGDTLDTRDKEDLCRRQGLVSSCGKERIAVRGIYIFSTTGTYKSPTNALIIQVLVYRFLESTMYR